MLYSKIKTKPHKINGLDSTAHIRFLKLNDLVEGEILGKKSNVLFVNLEPYGTGAIYLTNQVKAGPAVKNLKQGDRVSSKVVNLANEDGFIELSITEALEDQVWGEIEFAKRDLKSAHVKVSAVNRGGLIINYKNIQGFLPVSQLAPENYPRVKDGDKEKILEELKKFIGKELEVKVLDADRAESKLIVSQSAIFGGGTAGIENYSVGDVVDAEVAGLANFGVFVRFGDPPVEGLVHISELDYKLIQHPSEIVQIGDKIKVKIVNIENSRITLSLKSLKTDPWINIDEKYKKDGEYGAKVIKINPFGVFTELESGITGLCHISTIPNDKKLEELFTLGKTYKFKVLLIDSKKRKINMAPVEFIGSSSA